VIRTPFATIADCPRNGRALQPPPLCRAIVEPAYVDGLASLDGFTHLILIYWLDQAGPAKLRFTPPFDDTERGVFATRGPRRPNPIGLSVVQFDGVESSGVLLVRNLDCVDGTPLLDIKPYLSTTDAEPEASMGWLSARRGKTPPPGASG
jgi:tRNA-Thr(GGU) m(6)t(6)A37 methyltransferase TsaA